MDDATQKSEAESVQTLLPHLELQILSSDKPERRLPFYSECMSLAEHAPGMLDEGTSWQAECNDGEVRLTHPQEEPIPLQAGQSLTIEGAHITLLDLRKPPTALLMSMDGLSWQLFFQRYQVGRRGKRLNHIEFSDPTVSRQQATFVPNQSEGFNLLCESGSSPTLVNEKTLSPGDQEPLQHGDMVRFGNLVFRYLNHREDTKQVLFGLKTLGTFEVALNGQRLNNDISSAKTRWLLALLGIRWGQPVAVEWLIGQFWPSATTSRARKNLGVALKQIRECMELSEDDFAQLLTRSRTHLKLNPPSLGSHDFCDVKALISEGKALTSLATVERLATLYQGPFLEDCYEDWALAERESLSLEIVACLSKTVSYFGGLKDLSTARKALAEVAKLAPTHQEAVESFMQAALETAAPEEAVAVFEELQERLNKDELEPDISLLKLYYRAQSGT